MEQPYYTDKELRDLFSLFDKSQCGAIALDDLRKALCSLGQNPSDSELRDMFAAADKDTSGVLDFAEFAELARIRAASGRDALSAVLEAFRVFDTDHDGFLSVDELRHVVTTFGDKMSEAEAEAMIWSADRNGDGRIDYGEFARMLLDSPVKGIATLRVVIVEACGLAKTSTTADASPRVAVHVQGKKSGPLGDVSWTDGAGPGCLEHPEWNCQMKMNVVDTLRPQLVFRVCTEEDDNPIFGTAALHLVPESDDGEAGDFWLPLKGKNVRGGKIHVRVHLFGSDHAHAKPVAPAPKPVLRKTKKEEHSRRTGPLEHARFAPEGGSDFVRDFMAFRVCFDGPDDDDGDGVPDLQGVPTWVAYEIRAVRAGHPGAKYAKPKHWTTDWNLASKGIIPDEKAYDGSKMVRGAMCPKIHADRLGSEAGIDSHTVMNLCPQSVEFNGGIWSQLDLKCLEWADRFGAVWIVAGPLFNRPAAEVEKIGADGKFKVWVPDGFWKVAFKEDSQDGPISILAWKFDHLKDTEANPWSREKEYDLTQNLVPFGDLVTEAKLQWILPSNVSLSNSLW